MNIDSNIIQRCIDGELCESEQQELIHTLDQDVTREGWRRLGLEFLEEQLLRNVFRDPCVGEVEDPVSISNDRRLDTVAVKAPVKKLSPGAWQSLPLIAASVVIGMLSGSFGLRMWSGTAEFEPVAVHDRGTDAATNSQFIAGTQRSEEVNPFDENAIRYVDAPGTSPPVVPAPFFVPNIDNLLENGWELSREPHNFRVRSGNGREANVPGQSFRVIPAVQ